MGLTAKEFAEKNGINSKKIKLWYDNGYLGTTTKDKKPEFMTSQRIPQFHIQPIVGLREFRSFGKNYSMLHKIKTPFFQVCIRT